VWTTSGAQAADQNDQDLIAGLVLGFVERVFAALACAASGCGLREGYAQLYFLGAVFLNIETARFNRPERLRAIARRLAARPNKQLNKH